MARKHSLFFYNSDVTSKNTLKPLEPPSILPHVNDNSIKLDISDWSVETEKEIKEFANLCHKDSITFKKRGQNNKRKGTCLQVTLIVLGSLNVLFNSIPSLSYDVKLILSSLSGGLVSVISSFLSIFKYNESAHVYYEVSEGLNSLERSIKLELYKPYALRPNPMELFLLADETRTKLLKRV